MYIYFGNIEFDLHRSIGPTGSRSTFAVQPGYWPESGYLEN